MSFLIKILLIVLPLTALAQDRIEVLPKYLYSSGNKITHIPSGEVLEKARWELIFSATSSIYLSTFTLSPDEVGKEMFELLCYKAKHDVEVRVLVDHKSSKNFYNYSQKLRDCGAFTIQFRPDDQLYAMHEKLLIVDGERMIMGGSNYSEKYHIAAPNSDGANSKLRKKGRFGWYDSDYKIEGPAACEFHMKYRQNFKHLASYLADYNTELYHYGLEYFKGIFTEYYGLKKFRSCVSMDKMGDERIIPILGQPYHKSERPIMHAHLAGISQTKKGDRILLYAPYFVPGENYVSALAEAVKRGVDVNVITNSVESNDEQSMGNILFIGMVEAIRPMLKAGVKVHIWKLKSTIHRKGGLYGKVAFFGSDNLDNRGQEYSSESVIFTDSPTIVNGVIEDYAKDLERGTTLLSKEYIKKIYDNSSWLEIQAGKLLKKYF